jgi:hypothetical protein
MCGLEADVRGALPSGLIESVRLGALFVASDSFDDTELRAARLSSHHHQV